MGLDVPQEEEIAIANSCHVSSLHHFTFPRRAREYFDKYAMMQGLTPHELAIWDRTFMEIVRKATYWAQGKQLVMKSPTNSGRIAHLLRLFPEAVFIHIVRNPFEVYRSFMHLYNKFMPPNQLQVMDPQDMADHLVHAYRGMMGGIIEDRSLVPDGRFLEIRFENLEQRPIAELQRTYAELKIPGWDRARPALRIVSRDSLWVSKELLSARSLGDRQSKRRVGVCVGGMELPTASSGRIYSLSA